MHMLYLDSIDCDDYESCIDVQTPMIGIMLVNSGWGNRKIDCVCRVRDL